jgi:hypothetical protein
VEVAVANELRAVAAVVDAVLVEVAADVAQAAVVDAVLVEVAADVAQAAVVDVVLVVVDEDRVEVVAEQKYSCLKKPASTHIKRFSTKV